MHKCFLLLGSNLGNRLGYLRSAIQKIDTEAGKVNKISPVYETDPWHFKAEKNFMNCAIEISTSKLPRELLSCIQDIEKQLGRQRSSSPSYNSREIDIDIIFFDDEIIRQDDLQIPHPQIAGRRFVLEPLNCLAADKLHPELKKTIAELLAACTDSSKVEQIMQPIL
jgi:2-amino-4-hydroxy-6-hydroxymethyldihydropteridine diphosphokinase